MGGLDILIGKTYHSIMSCNHILERSLIPFLINFYISNDDKPEITIDKPSNNLINIVNILFNGDINLSNNESHNLVSISSKIFDNNKLMNHLNIHKKRIKRSDKHKSGSDENKSNIKDNEKDNINDESRLKNFLKNLTKSSLSYSKVFYNTHTKLYLSDTIDYKENHGPFEGYLVSSMKDYWSEYFGFNPSQEVNFRFK